MQTTGHVEVWTAEPQAFGEISLTDMACLLDERELSRSRQFRLDADCRAYLVAHALRRVALAGALGVRPQEIVFSTQPKGKTVLAWPERRELFFSLSRTRELVACALTHIAPIGIDVEPLRRGPCETEPAADKPSGQDLRLLEDFVAFTQEQRQAMSVASEPALKLFFGFYWTVLEAFWKAVGSGLSFDNPRIVLRQQSGVTEVFFDADGETTPRASVLPAQSPSGASLSVVLAASGITAARRLPLMQYNTLDFSNGWAKSLASQGFSGASRTSLPLLLSVST